MSKKQLEALELNRQGMSQEEIAKKLGISRGAVSLRLHGCLIKGEWINKHFNKKQAVLDTCGCYGCKNYEENIKDKVKIA